MVGTIAVVLPAVDRWFLNELARGAQERAAREGHTTVTHRIPLEAAVSGGVAERIEEAFAAPDSLGAIADGFPYQGHGAARMLTWQRPVVIIGGSVMGFPTVSFDDVGIGRTSTQHLLDLGHRRIAHISSTIRPQEGFVFLRRRARGYRMTMEGAGLTPQFLEVDLGSDRSEAAIESLLRQSDRPTAVFAGYDEIAFVVVEAAQRLGLQIGRDLSVVGVNDHPTAEQLGLTTTRLQPGEVGAAAVEMILDGLRPGVGHGNSRLQPGSFMTRASTARPGTP